MFCFAIREECKGQECAAWKNEDCILIRFMEKSIEDLENKLYRIKVPEKVKNATIEELETELLEYIRSRNRDDADDLIGSFWLSKGIISKTFLPLDIYQKVDNVEDHVAQILEDNKEEEVIPEYVKINTAEDIAAELSEYMKNIGYYRIDYNEENEFWTSKGISSIRSLPDDVGQKIEMAKKLAGNILAEEREDRLSKERADTRDLADSCVTWARSQGITTVVTKQIVESFLSEKDVDLLPETKTILYNLANTKSKMKPSSS